MMLSKHKFLLLSVSLSVLGVSSNVMAAGKCAVVRTESTFELTNAPAEEMLNSRNSTAINCVIISDFIARSKAKAGSSSGVFTSMPAPSTTSSGAYVPKTKDDNTPWRFDMNQNGKRMTSVEFDAWMKAKGIRVATGKPGADAAATPVDCTPTKDKAC